MAGKLSKLSDAELIQALEMERIGRDGEQEFDAAADRHAALESPYFYATKIVDGWYGENFEPKHQYLLDDVLKPWILGERVTINDETYDPLDFIGLFVGWPRSTFKSSCIRLILGWAYCYFKCRLNEDLTTMMVHQVQEKAIDHGEAVRATAKDNVRYRKAFPEFAVDTSKDWDKMALWGWPNLTPESRQAKLWSFTAYGETSSKIGGHYKLRLVDDWESEDSVTTPEMIGQSERRLRQFDNLGVRGRKWNPWIVAGTYYHYDGVYKRLEKGSGWLSWVVSAHEGTSKEIFDLVSLDPRSREDKAKIDKGIRKLERERSDDLNFPKIYPWRELYKAAMGQRSDDDGEMRGGFYEYSCQVLMAPVPKGQTRFDYDALQAGFVDTIPPPGEMLLYCRIDPAISKKRKTSDTVITIGGVKWDRKRYVLHTWIGKERRPTIIVRRAIGMVRKWLSLGYTVENLGVESVAFQESMRQQFIEGVPERDAAYEGESVPIMLCPVPAIAIPRGSDATKLERQLSLDGPISRRELYWWSKDPMGRRSWKQFIEFPYGQMDAIDTIHDLWIRTKTPPMPLEMEEKLARTPKEVLKALGFAPSKRSTVGGLSQSCRLASWNN